MSSLLAVGTSGRSREGAWIEMPLLEKLWPYGFSRSREGAWIEIPANVLGRSARRWVAPARERGLKYQLTF